MIYIYMICIYIYNTNASYHECFLTRVLVRFSERMLRIHVSFPSGSGETLLPPEHSKVGDLKMLAQRSLGRGFLKLVTIDGHVLTNPEVSLQAAELQDGQHLTAVAQEAKIATTGSAFAVWCCGGNKVLSWGNPDYGGDCSAVQDQLVHL